MDTEKALKITKIISQNCDNSPHDIGLKLVVTGAKIGTSYIQRLLRLGYDDAEAIIDDLVLAGLYRQNPEQPWIYELVE